MYIKRHLEKVIERAQSSFKLVLLTGPRQVGKTTVLRQLFQDQYGYVSLDDLSELQIAKTDPKLFFLNHPGKMIIDEVQQAPELFHEIKRLVDEKNEMGRFLLTGSQSFSMMQNVTETLAGRVGIIEMQPLSSREIAGAEGASPFIPSAGLQKQNGILFDSQTLWQLIHRGFYPELHRNPELDWQLFYSSYLRTYIERDVRQIAAIRDLTSFQMFMSSLAARVGQQVNYHSIAQDLGVDQKTIKSWLSILQATGLIYIIYPFSNNALKRSIKAPVLYFSDTGLAAYLGRWLSPETLQRGALSGAILENYVIAEIMKSFINAGYTNPGIYYYRDKEQNEIDLIIEEVGSLSPI